VLNLPATVRVFVALEPVNMSGSFDALAGRVRRLGLPPEDGHLYVFVNRRRHILAILYFDGAGWVVTKKRLEKGTFQLPTTEDGATRLQVDSRVLAAIFEGIDLHAPRRRWFERNPAAAK
jgi:transposase